ncbi:hypothetical protein [Streptomyces sp. NPDC086782]|uniref:hypothetical protein n=1 Tax=Streptomyces sp. NPDC086782 TaxID=3365757 RepID=UPI00381D5FB1
MSDTSPQWLADAEARYERRQKAEATRKALAAFDHAESINGALGQLGIIPIAPAAAPDGCAALTPALLVKADPEEELHGVHAGWDENEGKVRLLLDHHWGEYTGLRPGRLLTSVDDVVIARSEGPAVKPEPTRTGPQTWDLRKIAEDAARTIPSDVTSHDAGEITQMLSGLTAAVLCLADTVSGTCGRP